MLSIHFYNYIYFAMNYKKIENFTKERKIDFADFFLKIEMTSAGYYRMMKEKTLKVNVLEKIAAYFDVPVSTFFDEPVPAKPTDYQKKYIECLEENNQLQKEISRMKDEIRNLEKNTSVSTDVHIPKLKK